jgi:hypothetical protein
LLLYFDRLELGDHMIDRIKILFLEANPADISYRLRLEEEVREIEKRIQAGNARDSFELISRWAVTPSDLQALLLRHEPHILHFSGHGTTKGIALENDLGNVTVVSKKALVNLFELFKEKIRLVLLNPSYSRPQAKAFRQSVDFAVEIKKGVGEPAAIGFAAALYQELAAGRSANDAFKAAKVDLHMRKVPRSKEPILNIREGADATSPLFALKASSARLRKPSKPVKDKPLGGINVGRDSITSTLLIGDAANVAIRKLKGRANKDDRGAIKGELEATLQRAIAGTSTKEDQRTLQRAVFSGWLIFDAFTGETSDEDKT